MSAPAGRAGADRSDQEVDRPESIRSARAPQAVPPIERHEPIPMDKIALFEVAPVHRLARISQTGKRDKIF
jgi:hypothetical protein